MSGWSETLFQTSLLFGSALRQNGIFDSKSDVPDASFWYDLVFPNTRHCSVLLGPDVHDIDEDSEEIMLQHCNQNLASMPNLQLLHVGIKVHHPSDERSRKILKGLLEATQADPRTVRLAFQFDFDHFDGTHSDPCAYFCKVFWPLVSALADFDLRFLNLHSVRSSPPPTIARLPCSRLVYHFEESYGIGSHLPSSWMDITALQSLTLNCTTDSGAFQMWSVLSVAAPFVQRLDLGSIEGIVTHEERRQRLAFPRLRRLRYTLSENAPLLPFLHYIEAPRVVYFNCPLASSNDASVEHLKTAFPSLHTVRYKLEGRCNVAGTRSWAPSLGTASAFAAELANQSIRSELRVWLDSALHQAQFLLAQVQHLPVTRLSMTLIDSGEALEGPRADPARWSSLPHLQTCSMTVEDRQRGGVGEDLSIAEAMPAWAPQLCAFRIKAFEHETFDHIDDLERVVQSGRYPCLASLTYETADGDQHNLDAMDNALRSACGKAGVDWKLLN